MAAKMGSVNHPGGASGVWACGKPKVSITFEPNMFKNINDMAKVANVSFAEQVRRLVGFALNTEWEE